MKEAFRLGATLVVWVALAIILTSDTSNVSGSATVLLILAGFFSTVAIWVSGAMMLQAQNDEQMIVCGPPHSLWT